MSFFNKVETLPEDPILSLPLLFAKDPHKHKVNLGIGSYKDDQGQPYVLNAVTQAEKKLCEKKLNKEYLPIQGCVEFIAYSQQLIFGNTLTLCQDRIFGLQSLGGTGALRVAGEFLFRNGFKKICIPDPTWANHTRIFQYAGLEVQQYPYYNVKDRSLDFQEMCKTLEELPEQTIVLLHACCHNPSGLDPSRDQWQVLSKLMKQKKLIPLFDLAYQGFGKNLDEDVYAVRYFNEQQHEMFVAQSYAKNMGLYGERSGSLSIIVQAPDRLKSVSSQLKQIVRSMYSNPPLHSERIVATILQDAELHKLWIEELALMRNRIDGVRRDLILQLKAAEIDFTFLASQTGMFCYMGLSHEQVMSLRQEFGVYVAEGGRANLAGITSNNLECITNALIHILKVAND